MGVYLYFKSGDTVNVQKVEPHQNGGKSPISTVFNGDGHVNGTTNQGYIQDKYWSKTDLALKLCIFY